MSDRTRQKAQKQSFRLQPSIWLCLFT